jgi:hypothetical protein
VTERGGERCKRHQDYGLLVALLFPVVGQAARFKGGMPRKVEKIGPTRALPPARAGLMWGSRINWASAIRRKHSLLRGLRAMT